MLVGEAAPRELFLRRAVEVAGAAPGGAVPGTVLDGFRVACATGVVELLELQW